MNFYFKVFGAVVWLMVASGVALLWIPFSWVRGLSVNRVFARLYAWGSLKIIGVRVKILGEQYLSSTQPCIVVANHQSMLDLSTFGSMVPPRMIVIGKRELAWIPLFNLLFVTGGNILLDRKRRNRAMIGIGQAVAAIRERQLSIFIFPEGTRNVAGEGLLPFKKGAFHMALAANVPVVPIVSSSLRRVFDPSTRHLPGGTVVLRILPPIDPAPFFPDRMEEFAAHVRARMLEGLQEAELEAK